MPLDDYAHGQMKPVQLPADHPLRAKLDVLESRGFWLRDDLEIRRGVPEFAGIEQAYSLWRGVLGHGIREMVYGDPLEWAIDQALQHTAQG